MKVDFRSFLIIKQREYRAGSQHVTETTYDMGSVRHHTLEVSPLLVMIHWRHLIWFPLCTLGMGFLIFLTSACGCGMLGGILGLWQGPVWDYPIACGILGALVLASGYGGSCHLVLEGLMKGHARRDRGARSARLRVVNDNEWEAFVSKLSGRR